MPPAMLSRDMVGTGLGMPLFHECPNDAFCLAVGPWMLHLREVLRKSFSSTQVMDRMSALSLVLTPVVRIDSCHRKGHGLPGFFQEDGRRVCRLVREDVGKEPPRVVVDCHKEILPWLNNGFSPQERKAFGIEMDKLSWHLSFISILFVLLATDLLLHPPLCLQESFESIAERPIAVVHGGAVDEDLESSIPQGLIDGLSGDCVCSCEVGHSRSHTPATKDFPSLIWEEFGILVHDKRRVMRLMVSTPSSYRAFVVSRGDTGYNPILNYISYLI
jgi:hypothetical protein